MKKKTKRNLLTTVIFTIIIFCLAATANLLLPNLMSAYWVYLILFFAAVTLLLLELTGKIKDEKFAKFSNIFMIVSSLKLVLIIMAIGAYSHIHKTETVRFAVTLMVFYFLYLFFEVYMLTSAKHHSAKS